MTSNLTGWTRFLSEEVYSRLCNCATRRTDIKELVDAKWRRFQEVGKNLDGFTKEDAIVEVLELLDANSREFELTIDEYNELTRN